MQLKISSHNDIIFEWVPYNQFDDIKIIGEGGLLHYILQSGKMVHYVIITQRNI